MIISDRPLSTMVPLQPAAMEGRTICQWDKDSCGDAGFLKIDLLGLGMLSAVEECVVSLAEQGADVDLSRIPLDDAGVYAEIQAADTVGVFQIESRAQMQMLLRTQPQNLDDLVVEVALVRPGPIQGGAVHPYIQRRLARRADPEFPIPYDHPLLTEALAETLGVIVFQDQVLAVAEALAGFSPGQAEELRRAMSRRRSEAAMRAQWDAFRDGAAAKDVPEHTAALVFEKILAFSAFGFPKAHSAAFALLAYQSAWLRRYHPAAFLCSLLNAQPMGFYPPASLIRDGQRRGVEVLPPDVTRSGALCRLEHGAVRIGLGYVPGSARRAPRQWWPSVRQHGDFVDGRDLATRLALKTDALERLVASGRVRRAGAAPASCCGSSASPPGRSPSAAATASWRSTSASAPPPCCPSRAPGTCSSPTTPTPACRCASIRSPTSGATWRTSSRAPTCRRCPTARRITIPGLAIARQRPASANGVVFLLLEDEHGLINLILMPDVYERFRLLARTEPLLLATGTLERRDRNINVQVERLEPLETPGRRTIGGRERARGARRPPRCRTCGRSRRRRCTSHRAAGGPRTAGRGGHPGGPDRPR